MAFSPSAGYVYRCPLCSQCFGGRPLAQLQALAAAAEADPALVRPITIEIARNDPRVLEHLNSHPASDWFLKLATLEQTINELREHADDRYYEGVGAATAEAGERE